MILTQQDVLLIKQTFDKIGYTGYADRFGAFLVDNQDEEEFVVIGRQELITKIEKVINDLVGSAVKQEAN